MGKMAKAIDQAIEYAQARAYERGLKTGRQEERERLRTELAAAEARGIAVGRQLEREQIAAWHSACVALVALWDNISDQALENESGIGSALLAKRLAILAARRAFRALPHDPIKGDEGRV